MQKVNVKTFVFEKIQTQESSIVEYEVKMTTKLINLTQIFESQMILRKGQIQIYDPRNNQFIPTGKVCKRKYWVNKQILQPQFIFIRYSQSCLKIADSDNEGDSAWQGESYGWEKRQTKNKQRNIWEALQVVKKWRNLHKYGEPGSKKRLNLFDASQVIGVSRKTLDDYYLMLRQAQQLNFDFMNNLKQKIGVLRAFVKKNRDLKQQKRNWKNRIHPKKLRILDSYDIDNKWFLNVEDLLNEDESAKVDITYPLTKSGDEEMHQQPQQIERQVSKAPYEDHMNEQNFENQNEIMLEDSFFNAFDRAPQSQEDCYNNGNLFYDIEQGFTKRQIEQQKDEMMFF